MRNRCECTHKKTQLAQAGDGACCEEHVWLLPFNIEGSMKSVNTLKTSCAAAPNKKNKDLGTGTPTMLKWGHNIWRPKKWRVLSFERNLRKASLNQCWTGVVAPGWVKISGHQNGLSIELAQINCWGTPQTAFYNGLSILQQPFYNNTYEMERDTGCAFLVKCGLQARHFCLNVFFLKRLLPESALSVTLCSPQCQPNAS